MCRGWRSSRPFASSLRRRRLSVRHASKFFLVRGRSSSAEPHSVAGAGAFFLLDRGAVSVADAEGGDRLERTGYGGRRRRLWTRVGPFSRITSAMATAGGTLRPHGGPPPPVRPLRRYASAGA
ncbi:unnamed protein product [Pleuronectes platessa]|uniref:Uncharacterized protein n=1 Tax=Pleuronectes platessa TaxID=8262 RepID=A0A9N7YTM6_PLEPL|nr:unnamed protein product [Pleuronectes platessa]